MGFCTQNQFIPSFLLNQLNIYGSFDSIWSELKHKHSYFLFISHLNDVELNYMQIKAMPG